MLVSKVIYFRMITLLATPLVAGNPLESLLPPTYRKVCWGTRLMAVPNGNNVKNWAIRRREPKSVMAGYGSVSTIAKRWVSDDGLANRSLLKVRSSPLWKLRGISDFSVFVTQERRRCGDPVLKPAEMAHEGAPPFSMYGF